MKPNLLATMTFLITSCFSYAQTDQELVWASYFGGTGYDHLYSVAITEEGGVIAVGRSSSDTAITTNQCHQCAFGGGEDDGLIVKLSANKELEWASYFGGEDEDTIYDVKILSDGSFVIVGSSKSVTGISTSGSFMEESTGVTAAFVSRFSALGEQIWGTYLGGSGISPYYANATRVEVDLNENIIVAGFTSMENFPTSNNVHQNVFGGDRDGFITKFDSTGNLIWSTYYGGPGDERISDLVISSSNEIVVFGSTDSEVGIATNNAHQAEFGGYFDALLGKFSPNGQLQWGSYYGGADIEHPIGATHQSLAVDQFDNFYVRLETMSEDNIATSGSHNESLDYDRTTALAKFTGDGELEWGTYFGGLVLSLGGGIAILDGRIVISGILRDDEGYLMGNPFQTDTYFNAIGGDVFLAGFTTEGVQLWGTYYGGYGGDIARFLSPYLEHQFMLVGSTLSNSNLGTENGFQPNHAGGTYDGLMAIFDISNVTSIAEKEAAQLKVFPNPTTSNIRLELPPEFAFRAAITVYNATGQVVARNENFNSLDPLPMSHPPGLYVVEARSDAKVAREKVVVE